MLLEVVDFACPPRLSADRFFRVDLSGTQTHNSLLVQSSLQWRGVASVVEFDRLARGGFSAHVRLEPATPEFTAEIFDVTLECAGPFAFPTISTVKLVRPV